MTRRRFLGSRSLATPIPTMLRLVAITDDLRDGVDGLVARAAAAVRGGATMVHLRLEDVDARDLVRVARALVGALPVPVIVNGRADVALASGAAGVHVGVHDIPPAALRRITPPGFLIGASIGSEKDVASASHADYVNIGPVFPVGTGGDDALGIDEFGRLAKLVAVPAVAIGGINAGNGRQVFEAGAAGVAAIRAIFTASDPERAARALSSAIGS